MVSVSEKDNLTFTFFISSWAVLSRAAKPAYLPTYIIGFTHLTINCWYLLKVLRFTAITVQLIYVWSYSRISTSCLIKGCKEQCWWYWTQRHWWWSFQYPSLYFPLLLYSGPLAYCCGRYSLWDTCPTPAKATRRFWSLSPMEEGWIHLKTVLALCMRF